MKIVLNEDQLTITVRGQIEDGPVIPEGRISPWTVQITGFEAVLNTFQSPWNLESFTCIGQILEEGRIDPKDDFRYRKTFDPVDCPDWAHRLIERVAPLGRLPLVVPKEFYLL